jgi:glycosyltransferase involved in cell wall biosynthesis
VADRPRVRWFAPVFNSSGYADETRNFVLGLRDLGWQLHLVPNDDVRDHGILTRAEYDALLALTAAPDAEPELEVQHVAANMALAPVSQRSVIRTMFETDRLTTDWVDVCNRFAEVWVPTEFNRETFARAGVVEEKLRVVPESLDTGLYDPARHRPMPLPGPRGFRFVSVFDWTARKGWDVLLRAYLEEFRHDEDVSLVIKATNFHNRLSPQEFVRQYLAEEGWSRPAHIEVIDRHLTTAELISLYLAGDAFVLPSRGEGWGRPYMEAMSLGVPVIGTRWSGNLAFMNDGNSYLIEIDGLEPADRQGWDHYQGHLWANPSVESTREQMRRVHRVRGEARERAARASAEIRERFSREAVARLLADEMCRVAG